MNALPVTDRSGNELLAIDLVDEFELSEPHHEAALPLSLVVLRHAGKVLMIFNRWRQEWELPGGMIEAGETPRQAALRELEEETGVSAGHLDFEARALFSLKRPDRLEYAAVYSTHLTALPELRTNEEASAFLWWTPTPCPEENMSSLDAALAFRIAGSQRPPRIFE
ncbi:8-oxo-dGTP diphosphatase [Arthrobacter pascens]|uniref:NUDIX hydrolase n=1 Tax=Arthrobacter pascens TaxID=1677 RepID=UPI00278F4316|nr:NUDIX hydrolase [Arthrobacter pascens]MDQ0678325.1 8-oxo-dGTP diphosphatase [Arthrobacter pascens]